MGFGTDHGRAVPYIWHKKVINLPLNIDRASGPSWLSLTGTQCGGTIRSLLFLGDNNKLSDSFYVPGDWDGTSNFVLRLNWSQYPPGSQKDATMAWRLQYWVVEDWGNPVGSKSVSMTATWAYGDEGTTNYALHNGTFAMDFTGGTFGTVGAGQTVFFQIERPAAGGSWAAISALHSMGVEYMAGVTGPSGAALTTQDKRGS